MVITGLFVGVLFGFVLQRGRFCMNSAFRDAILLKDNYLLKAVGAAILVEMFGFAIMSMTGAITHAPKPFFWAANIIGGFIFGIGMVLAGGCASGINYRVGEGMVGAITAVLGLTLGAYITKVGFLHGIMASLQSTKYPADGPSLNLAGMLGMEYATLALILFVILTVVWLFVERGKGEGDKGWGWLTTGTLVGLTGILAFPLHEAYPIGITKGWLVILLRILGKIESLPWISWLVIGIIVGAFVAAMIAKEFKFRVPSIGDLLKTFGGGLLMGFGAVTSSGCNVTHILSGIPQLSIGSFVGGAFIIIGAWAASYVMFVLPMKKES